MNLFYPVLSLFGYFIIFDHQVNAEIYSSFEQLSNLADSIPHILKTLQQTLGIKELEELLQDIKNCNSSDEFVSNPMNSFHLIKLCKDLKTYSNKISFINSDYNQNVTSLLPDQEDYIGSIQNINRIIETYSIEPHDFRIGLFLDKYKSRPLTALECYEIARVAFDDEKKFYSHKWLNESLESLKQEGQNATIEKHKVNELFALIHEHVGNINRAYDFMNECLHDQPENPVYLRHLRRYEEYLQDPETASMDETEIVRVLRDYDEKYYNLCKQSYATDRPSNLTCKYKSDHPFLVIGPIKEEQVSLDPLMHIYYDVITNRQGDIKKNLCNKKYFRSTFPSSNGTLVKMESRITQICWLDDFEHKSLSYLTELVKSITKLSVEYAESWQVGSYGTGGHFRPHFDFFTNEKLAIGRGNRFATMLFYIDSPEVGGATVFPELNLKISPVKNSAVFWTNLRNDGRGDVRTLHGSCPVVYGRKVISSKLFHEFGNEFTRPCIPLN